MQKYYMVTFVNMYVAGIHAGIQSAHAISRLQLRARVGRHQNALETWDVTSPTILVKNGKSSDNMHRLAVKLEELACAIDMPMAVWHEPDLDNAMTAIAILVPASIVEYEGNAEQIYSPFSEEEYALMKLLRTYHLAR